MPASRADPDAVQREIGSHFQVVPGRFPVHVKCLACGHEGSKPFRYAPSALKEHISSKKHEKNARNFHPARDTVISAYDLPLPFDGLPDDDGEDSAPAFADDAALPIWFDGESRDAFWMMVDQREDVIAGLEVELAELRREEQALADAHAAHGNPMRHLLGQEQGSWGPFKEKRIFAALSFLLSPRQAHSLTSLEHALGLAEALGAHNVPSINDFANVNARQKMNFLPRRTSIVRELRDGVAVAVNSDERTVAPMIRFDNGKEVWIKQVYEYGEQLIFPQCFFEGENGTISGEGRLVRREGNQLRLTDIRTTFRAELLNHESNRRLSALSLVDGDQELSHVNSDRVCCDGKRLFSIPIVLFIDDLSGARSKRWNKHEATYLSNATLDRSDLDLDSNIKLVSISKAVSGEGQLSAIVDELIHLHQNPFTAYDCELKEDVMVRPYLLSVMADNPMAASLTSSIGLMGNKCCRMCDVDGSKETLQTAEGFVRYLRPGSARSVQTIKAALTEQLDAAERGQPQSFINELRKQTGIKDTLTTKFCDTLTELRRQLREQGQSRDEIDQAAHQRRREIESGNWYGPLLRLHDVTGFEVCAGLPIEALHTWLLGPMKYLVAEVTRTVKKETALFQEVAARLSSMDLDGIGESSSLDGTYLLNNSGGLTGKDMRALSQVLWLALLPLRDQGKIQESLWAACRWAATQFRTALANFFAAMVLVDPKQMRNKRKYHLMTHLEAGISLYGPAKGFATERYESFNTVARNASMCSNRAAPSRDIALRLYGQELVRQVMLEGRGATRRRFFFSSFQREQVERTVITRCFGDAALHLFDEEYVDSSELEYHSLRFVVSNAHERIYPDSFVQVDARLPPETEEEGHCSMFGDPVGLEDEHPNAAKGPLFLVQPMYAGHLSTHGVRTLVYGQGRYLLPFATIRGKFNISHHCAKHNATSLTLANGGRNARSSLHPRMRWYTIVTTPLKKPS
ncbi:unnamed protein product [Tilletia caries]|nr:unnamed protein product [Tilletia caries]